jgi:cation/acetate symporter
LWFGIQPLAAGVFGVPVGAAVLILVSYCTPAPSAHIQIELDRIRI